MYLIDAKRSAYVVERSSAFRDMIRHVHYRKQDTLYGKKKKKKAGAGAGVEFSKVGSIHNLWSLSCS